MGDYKMSCPGCDAWTNSVGLALRDGNPCPHCGLPAEATRLVLAAQERSADEALTKRFIEAEQRAGEAERKASAGAILARDLKGLLDQYEANLTRKPGDW